MKFILASMIRPIAVAEDQVEDAKKPEDDHEEHDDNWEDLLGDQEAQVQPSLQPEWMAKLWMKGKQYFSWEQFHLPFH